jgi:putative endonuclease
VKPARGAPVLVDMVDPVGSEGELAVARQLEERGFTVLARNLRLGHAEVDLLARRRSTLLVVEVKTRAAPGGPAPEASVGPRKRRQLTAAAGVLARRHPGTILTVAVAAVQLLPGREPCIRWYLDPL